MRLGGSLFLLRRVGVDALVGAGIWLDQYSLCMRFNRAQQRASHWTRPEINEVSTSSGILIYSHNVAIKPTSRLPVTNIYWKGSLGTATTRSYLLLVGWHTLLHNAHSSIYSWEVMGGTTRQGEGLPQSRTRPGEDAEFTRAQRK
ncbi:hypothetical protein F5B22DRAFT_149608 [Xylaria bambusicola]|uniref:uncharacterized protein n=1 Tax=Xylaria bambusicola TaxID=326684 RepID=UPI002007C64A|nr:uncharacterized protein F5B22DRAFT_149608 [Xylaria bambusicola]KAI0526256.1 hypothetical protein F5B22DRAFT_149608 [Xylaria bambusicola]